MSTASEIFEEAVLRVTKRPEGWASDPLSVLLVRAITGTDETENLERAFMELVRDQLEVLETAMAAADEVDSGFETDVHPRSFISRLQQQIDAVIDLSYRMREAQKGDAGFYGAVRRERAADAQNVAAEPEPGGAHE